MKKQTGILLAGAVGALFATACLADDVINSSDPSFTQMAKSASVKCMGINKCKGKSACKTANNTCKKQNSCKGQGIVMKKSEKACTKAGGTVASDS